MWITAGLRAAHAEAGIKRCFKNRNKGRYAFMARHEAVQVCKRWIAILRHVRRQHPDDWAEM